MPFFLALKKHVVRRVEPHETGFTAGEQGRYALPGRCSMSSHYTVLLQLNVVLKSSALQDKPVLV